MKKNFIDLSPFRYSKAYRNLWIGSTLAGLGGQLTIVAVMLHVYDLTESTFAVSMIAVAGLGPMIIAGLYGGMLADAFDRRKVAIIAGLVTFASTAVLAALAWASLESVAALYVLTIINSSANAIVMATRSAIIPRLLPKELLPAAAALSGITMGIMVMVGPALAGILVAFTGYSWTYTLDLVMMCALFMGLWGLPALHPEGEVDRPGLKSLKSGINFLGRAPNIRMQYILDIIAMTFGQPIALFPAIGMLVLGGGEITSGVLLASIAAGAFISSLLSGQIVKYRWHGKGIQRAIAAYGAAISLFGLVLLMAYFNLFAPNTIGENSANIVLISLACVALALAGAADNVSAIYRSTMMQAAVPDNMRGRLQAIFIVVVAGGPRVGALYVGVFSTFAALWVPPVFGGIVIIGLVAMLARLHPRFREYDAVNPTP